MRTFVPTREPAVIKDILGVGVASLSSDEAVRLFQRRIFEHRFTKVGFLNAHNANVAATDPDVAAVLEDFIVLPDGVGVDVASKVLYGEAFPANLNGTDLIPQFLRAVRQPLTVALLGARLEIVEQAARKLRELAPQHTIHILNDGFFQKSQEAAILERLAVLRPDVLLVAMGVPHQELWIAGNLGQAHCTMPIAVGALFDFLSGAVPRAPALLRRLRLEWLFRLVLEPRRLWRRYIIGNPLFLYRVFRQKMAMARASR